MTPTQAFRKLAPEPLLRRAIAAKSLLATICGFPRRLRSALARDAVERIVFHSGLGDSANVLYGLVRSMKPQTCVEIGSARGKSACYIAMALKDNGRGTLYAIDPHSSTDWNDEFSVDTAEVFTNNVVRLGLADYVKMIRVYSVDAAADWSQPIDLLFIDGDHTYEGVKRDWELFVPYVNPFGVVLFHDTIWDLQPDAGTRRDMGVPRFVDELRRQGYPVITIDRDCGISIVQPRIGGAPLRRTLRSDEPAAIGAADAV
jgi:predicted O-methyltransferase YrrM